MPVDPSGNASRPPTPLPVTGQNADAPQVNVPVNDIYAIMNLLQFLDGRKPMRGDQNFNGYRATNAADAEDPQDYATLAQLQAMIASVAGIPTGSMIPMAGTVVPAGWLVLNGQEVSRETFPGLYAFALASGNLAATQTAKTAGQFGPGNGTATFTLPNLQADGGYFIRPVSSGRGIGTVQADDFKGHFHTGNTDFAGEHVHGGVLRGGQSAQNPGSNTARYGDPSSSDPAGSHRHGFATDPSGGIETRPKNIAYPVLIKT